MFAELIILYYQVIEGFTFGVDVKGIIRLIIRDLSNGISFE